MKETAFHAPPNPVAVDPQAAQLEHGDHPMLARGKLPDQLTRRRWGISVAISAPPMPHPVRVAPRVLPVGDSCDVSVTSAAREP